MLNGELIGTTGLSGEIQKEIIAGGAPIKSISVDGVAVKPDSKKNVNIELSGKVDKVEYSQDQTFADGSDGGAIGRLYMRFRDNTDNSIVAHCQGIRYTVPVRDASGNFYVSDPVQATHIATKRYVDNRFNGANKAVSFINYSAMISSLNALTNTSYAVGQNIMIVTLTVPDLWVSEIAEESVSYTYVSDDDFINELTTNGSVQVGYYKLSALETQKVDLTEYVKKTDYPTADVAGVVRRTDGAVGGINISTTRPGTMMISRATNKIIEDRTPNDYIDSGVMDANRCKPICPANIDYAVKRVLLDDKLNGFVYEGVDYSWTDEEKSTVCKFLGVVEKSNTAVAVVGNSIVQRAGSGNIKVPLTPTSDDFATSKSYVDGLVASLTGTEAPTTSTVASFVGQIYLDTTNNKMYMCFGIDKTNKEYTWTQIIRATDYAGNSIKGVVDVRSTFGMQVDQYGRIQTVKATDDEIKAKTNEYHPLMSKDVDLVVKTGLTTNTLEFSDEEKARARELLGIDNLIGNISSLLGNTEDLEV